MIIGMEKYVKNISGKACLGFVASLDPNFS